MQNIENDMDDLFRRASDKYPLNTGRGDWESIEKRLSVASLSDEPQKKGRKNNYKKLLLLLLLIGVSLLIGFMILNPNHRNYQAGIDDKQTNLKGGLNNKPIAKNNLIIDQSSEKINKIAIINQKKKISTGYNPSKEDRIISATIPNSENENYLSKNKPSKSYSFSLKNNKNATSLNPDNNSISDAEQRPEIKNSTDSSENSDKKIVQDRSPIIEKNLPIGEKKKAQPNPETIKENAFYTGLTAGPDFSKVQGGPFNGPGFGAGIIGGYKINSSFFLETGISIDTKYYYSNGNIFNKAAASMPDEMIINNLESRTRILEIPLNVGYLFYGKKNTNLFVATGIAAYIMTKEKNNYNFTENGSPGKMVGIYEKNNLKMPAVFDISAGLEERLSKLVNLRIEPYLKLPLQGIGVGKLPVTSAGIQVGITRQLK